MTIARALAVVAVTAVVLAGCALLPVADDPTPVVVPTLTPNPTPTPARETGLVAPAQVFGGDCEALFTAAEVSDIVGSNVSLRVETVEYVNQHGGINCVWYASAPYVAVIVAALPEAAVTYTGSTACDIETESGSTGCSLESLHGGVRLSGAVFREDNDIDALKVAQSALLDLFAQRAEGPNVVPLLPPAVGAWAWPADCSSVVAAGDFSAVPGLGSDVEGGESGGTDVYFPRAEYEFWGVSSPTCGVYNGDVYVDFASLGGGRWAETSVAALPGVTAVPVDGIDAVFVSPTEYEMIRVDAFDGPNWVSFYVRHASNAGVLAQALVAALDTTAIS